MYGTLAEDDAAEAGHFMHFLILLEVLVNTWAVAGAHEVHYKTATVRLANWPDLYYYMCTLRGEGSDKLRDYTESSVVLFVSTVDEALRTEAIGLMRGESAMPWGVAVP